MVSMLRNITRCLGIQDEKTKRDEHCPSDIENMSIGISVADRQMCVVIPCNTKIPIKKEVTFRFVATEFPYATTFQVYAGESSWTKDNAWLGEIFFDYFPPTLLVDAQIKVCFDIDANGTLRVSVQHMMYPKFKEEITITSKQRQSAKLRKAKHNLKKYAENIKTAFRFGGYGYPGELDAEEKQKIKKVAKEAIRWLKMNRSATVCEYKDKLKEVEDLCNPIITKMYPLDSGRPNVQNKPASQYPKSPRSVAPTATNEFD